MKKKEMKGYVLLALSIGLMINACSSKPITPPSPIVQQPIQSIQAGDINIPGIDEPVASVDPNAVVDATTTGDTTTGTTGDTTTGATTGDTTTGTTTGGIIGSTGTTGDTTGTTTTGSPTATSIPTATTTTVTPVPTATATTDGTTVTPAPTATAVVTPIPTPFPSVNPTPTSTPVSPPQVDPLGNETLAVLAEGKIYQPRGIDIRNGKIYISDYDKGGTLFNIAEGEIKILDTGGNVTKTIQGSTGSSLPKELNGIVSDGQRVWIVNRIPYAQSKNNIYSFTTDGGGRQNATIGLSGEAGTNFQDMAIDPSNQTLYIASRGDQSVIKINYDATGVKLNTQQLKFNGATPITPAGLGIDNVGNVYVTNAATNPSSIIKFNRTGVRDLEFNTKGKNGTGPTATGIGDVAFDQRNGGIIYVIAQVNGSIVILRFDAAGNFVKSFGSGTMQDPRGIAVSADGTIYVTDFAKNAIIQFAPGN